MKLTMLILSLVLPLSFAPMPFASADAMSIDEADFLQGDKVKIQKEELPEAARTTLSSDAYKGWTIGNIWKTKEGEFEVELKKGDALQVLKFDKAGKIK